MRDEDKTKEQLIEELAEMRKRADEALRESKEKALAVTESAVFAENVMDNTAIAAFVLNTEHQVVLWNKACEELTGVSSAEVIGTDNQWKPFYPKRRPTMADIVIEGDYNSVPGLYGKHNRSPLIADGFQSEGWYENMNGKNRYILFEAAPIYNSKGELSFAIETLQDITRRKRTEEELENYRSRLEDQVKERTAELREANRQLEEDIHERKKMEEEILKMHKLESIGVLAGGIAHDFNNLLSAIMGNISLARRHVPADNKVSDRLAEAERASARAMDLARQLLTFSKGGDPIKTALLLGEPVREAADFALRGSNIGLELTIPDDLWAVEADEGQIAQVVNNIVINARQAMPDGGKVSICCENVSIGSGAGLPLSEGNYVRVSISDDGSGINRDYLKRIFDPYFTTKDEGSGLGLATSYSIIKRHGGHLAVESELGAGATFHIYLPASEYSGTVGSKEVKRLFKGQGRALVMDDEEIIRIIIGEMLREIGYDCAFAEDGEKAVEAYREALSTGNPFDVVLIDLTVRGGMGGMYCIERLKQIDPGVKAIVSSGYSDDPVMARYREFGFEGLITKPYEIEDLSKVLSEVMCGGDAVDT